MPFSGHIAHLNVLAVQPSLICQLQFIVLSAFPMPLLAKYD